VEIRRSKEFTVCDRRRIGRGNAIGVASGRFSFITIASSSSLYTMIGE
jgi:hypothetical protein